MTKDEIKRIDDAGLAAWNKHDVEAFVRQFAERFTWSDWTMAEPMRDKAAARQYFSGWMTAFPDMSTKLINRVIDGQFNLNVGAQGQRRDHRPGSVSRILGAP